MVSFYYISLKVDAQIISRGYLYSVIYNNDNKADCLKELCKQLQFDREKNYIKYCVV